jgi:hypothetical protein
VDGVLDWAAQSSLVHADDILDLYLYFGLVRFALLVGSGILALEMGESRANSLCCGSLAAAGDLDFVAGSSSFESAAQCCPVGSLERKVRAAL